VNSKTLLTVPYGAPMPAIGNHPGGNVVQPEGEQGSPPSAPGATTVVVAFSADGDVTVDGRPMPGIDAALSLVKQRYREAALMSGDGADAARDARFQAGLHQVQKPAL
jgi:hypothetical protein